MKIAEVWAARSRTVPHDARTVVDPRIKVIQMMAALKRDGPTGRCAGHRYFDASLRCKRALDLVSRASSCGRRNRIIHVMIRRAA